MSIPCVTTCLSLHLSVVAAVESLTLDVPTHLPTSSLCCLRLSSYWYDEAVSVTERVCTSEQGRAAVSHDCKAEDLISATLISLFYNFYLKSSVQDNDFSMVTMLNPHRRVLSFLTMGQAYCTLTSNHSAT